MKEISDGANSKIGFRQARTQEYRSAMAAYFESIEPAVLQHIEGTLEDHYRRQEGISRMRSAVWAEERCSLIYRIYC